MAVYDVVTVYDVVMDCGMKKRGRPEIELTKSDLDELNAFIDSLYFLTKQQDRYKQISDKTQFYEDEVKLIKSNLREMKNHQKRLETFKTIEFKSSTTQHLTDLEAEILNYDWSIRDDFFNAHKALNTYIQLEKITHNEIKRIDQKVRNERIKEVRQQQTEHQKQRTAENRQKYFTGATVLRLKQIFKQDHIDDIDFLRWLAVSALMWKGADHSYSLQQDKYLSAILEKVGTEISEVTDFIEKAKQDKRQ